MAKKLVRKVLEMLRKLSKDDDSDDDTDEDSEDSSSSKSVDPKDHPYIKFWNEFGRSIKMGVMEDAPNRSKLAKLLRFTTSKTEEGVPKSLDAYIEDMEDWQKNIYFIAGESRDAVEKSPFLETAIKKEVEVLYLTEPIDEYVMQHLADYEGHKFQSLTKEGLKFGDEDEELTKKRAKIYRDTFKPLTDKLKSLFTGKVNKVTVSQRVETSPAVIVTSQYGQSANMERIMKAQTFANANVMKDLGATRTMELNPRHPIVVELNNLVVDSPDDQATTDMAWLLYDTSLLNSGFQQDDLDGFSSRMYRTMAANMNIASMELAGELDVLPDEDEDELEEAGDASEEVDMDMDGDDGEL
jgi:heat shock protein beta